MSFDTELWTWPWSSSPSPSSSVAAQPSIADRIGRLHNANPMFVSWSTITTTLLPCIVTVTLSLTILYCLVFYVVANFMVVVPSAAAKSSSDSRDHILLRQKQRKVAYQMTNMCVNCMLGCCGIYYYMYVLLPPPPSNVISLEDSISGFQDLYFLSCFQIGYQLWSIPMGLLYVPETIPMLLHHFTVMIVASLSCFHINGFRYWTSYFYGVLELSSVPLAIMNTFKDNPTWIATYPNIYMLIRLVFAVSFLLVRVVWYAPKKMRFLRDAYVLLYTHPSSSSSSRLYQIYMMFVWISSFTLWSLQMYWASLILKGLINTVLFKKKNKTTTNRESKDTSHKNGVVATKISGNAVSANGVNKKGE